jgi:hypothetical protein
VGGLHSGRRPLLSLLLIFLLLKGTFREYSRNVNEHSGNIQGMSTNIQGMPRNIQGMPRNIQRTFRECQGTFREHSGNAKEHSGNIRGMPRNIQGTFRECQGTFREHPVRVEVDTPERPSQQQEALTESTKVDAEHNLPTWVPMTRVDMTKQRGNI